MPAVATSCLAAATRRVAVAPWSVSASRAWAMKTKILAAWERTVGFCLRVGVSTCGGGSDAFGKERVCVVWLMKWGLKGRWGG